MPHIITGEIRKAPYTQTGTNSNGEWKMYAVELSESFKDKQGERQYTNYRATFFASKENIRNWYDHALAEGKIITATCESLAIQQRESNGKNYITLEMNNPTLSFTQRDNQQSRESQDNQQRGKPQQPTGNRPAPKNNPAPKQNEPPMDFDDDIPF